MITCNQVIISKFKIYVHHLKVGSFLFTTKHVNKSVANVFLRFVFFNFRVLFTAEFINPSMKASQKRKMLK